MRCLMFNMTGTGTFVEDWAVAATRSAEVLGFSWARARPDSAQPLAASLTMGEVAGIPVVFVEPPIRLRPKRLARRVNDRLEIRKMIRAVRFLEQRYGPIELLHSHFYAGSGAIPGLAKRLGLQFVHTEHSTRLLGDRKLARAGRAVLKQVMGQAAVVMFVSDEQLDFVRGQGVDGRFVVVPNPVDDRLFRVGHGGYPDEIRLITVGHLLPRKRHALLLSAVAQARKADSRIRLDVVGAGACRVDLEVQSVRLGLGSVVRFWGHADRGQVAFLLAQSDIYVHTSETETFGVAIVEALFSGLPVVVAAAGGVTRTIPASMGVTVNHPDPDIFAAAIVDVVNRLGTFKRETIAAESRQMFSASSVALRLGHIYEEALEREPQHRSMAP